MGSGKTFIKLSLTSIGALTSALVLLLWLGVIQLDHFIAFEVLGAIVHLLEPVMKLPPTRAVARA